MIPAISALQTAVSPMILISGVGLLLLTMTNRLGRAIDRARALASGDGLSHSEVRDQLDVLLLRARLLRRAILSAVMSALFAGALVIAIFLMVLLGKDAGALISVLFILALAALIFSLAFFMRDVNLSLSALETKLKVRG